MNTPAILTIDGEVERPGRWSAGDLATMDESYQVPDVSRLDPKRRGKAVRLAGLLAHSGVKPSAKYLTLHASADDFHASIPLESVRDRAVVIYEVDGQPLSAAAGGPFRFYIADYAACHSAEVDECANVKFVDRIELSTAKGFDNRPEDEKSHRALHERQS
jgi:DMSO/TMAO reductase YedYZ molybdopterin-dependent catalytic subunit